MSQASEDPSRLWRNRDFRIAWSAALVNDAGDWVLAIALPVFVFVETRSGAATSVLFVLQFAAGVLGPIGGSLVDRWDLRRVLIWTNLAQAAALMPLLAVTTDRIWPAYIVMGAQSALAQVNNPANISLLPRVVDASQLTGANAALSAAASIARLGGAALGGVLVAWRGLGPIILIDAVSFLAVALAVGFIRSDTSAGAAGASEEAQGRWRAAVKTIRAHPPLAQVLSIQGLAQLAQGGFVVLFVVFLVEALGDDGSGLGLIRGTMAIGALIGSAIIVRISKHVDPGTLFSVGLLGMGAVSLLFWNAPHITTSLWVYVGLFALSGIPGSALTVGLFSTIQSKTPRPTVGRVVGFLGTAEALGVAAGAIVAGALVDRVSLAPLLNGQAAIYLAASALAFVFVTRHRGTRQSSSTAASPHSSGDY